jgi:hypothetical protein
MVKKRECNVGEDTFEDWLSSKGLAVFGHPLHYIASLPKKQL